MLRFAWRKPHFPELVHVPAGAHAAVICSVRQLLRRQVDDEFARLPDNIVGIPLRPDGDGYHSRVGTDCPDPCRCDNIRFLTCPGAAYHDCRQGVEHIARPPVLPLSWRLLWRPGFSGIFSAVFSGIFSLIAPSRGSSLPPPAKFTSSLPSAESCPPGPGSAVSFWTPAPSAHRCRCRPAGGRRISPGYPRSGRSRAAPWIPG